MRFRWLVVVVSVAVAGCPTPEACGPQTCSGCCDAAGLCRLGSQHDGCGGQGARCVLCPALEVCVAHACQEPTDAGSDTPVDAGCQCPFGCCAPDGHCEAGTTPLACGAVGEVCTTCPAAARCERRACVEGPCGGCVDPAGQCADGAADSACGADGGLCFACAPGDACQAGQCQAATCSAFNCTQGCCTAAGQCAASTLLTCGLGGVTCATCTSSQQCVSGSCR